MNSFLVLCLLGSAFLVASMASASEDNVGLQEILHPKNLAWRPNEGTRVKRGWGWGGGYPGYGGYGGGYPGGYGGYPGGYGGGYGGYGGYPSYGGGSYGSSSWGSYSSSRSGGYSSYNSGFWGR